MKRHIIRPLAILLFLGLLLPPEARGDANKEAAVLLFKEANKLRKAKKYAEALKRYKTARKLLASFKIDYNIALTLEKMGRQVEAARAYQQFLKTGAGISPKRIKRVKKKLRRLKKKVAVLKVSCKVESAVIKVDGNEVGKTPLGEVIFLEPGKHRVKVDKEGHEPFSKELKLRKGKKKTVRVKLKVKKPDRPEPVVAPSWTTEEPGKKGKPIGSVPGKKPGSPPEDKVATKPGKKPAEVEKKPAAPPKEKVAADPVKKPVLVVQKPVSTTTESAVPVSSPPEDHDELDAPKRRGRLFTWIAAGAAGALAVAGLAVNLHTGSEFSDLKEACKPNCSDDQVDPLRTEATVSYVLFGLAGAAAITSVVLFFVEGRSERNEVDSASGGPFKVSPLMGGSSYGLQGHFTF